MLGRDIHVNSQKVYVDLSLRLDFSQSVIASAISWKGSVCLEDLEPVVRDLINLTDDNDAGDRAIAESTCLGRATDPVAETRANVSVARYTVALPAARFNKTELFALILNEVAVEFAMDWCIALPDGIPRTRIRLRAPEDRRSGRECRTLPSSTPWLPVRREPRPPQLGRCANKVSCEPPPTDSKRHHKKTRFSFRPRNLQPKPIPCAQVAVHLGKAELQHVLRSSRLGENLDKVSHDKLLQVLRRLKPPHT